MIATAATPGRMHHGVALPAIPREATQPVFALEAEAYLPRGYSLRETVGGLHLIRDGEDMGVMTSEEMACRHAAALERMAPAGGRES